MSFEKIAFLIFEFISTQSFKIMHQFSQKMKMKFCCWLNDVHPNTNRSNKKRTIDVMYRSQS